jgi:hypothetical protein
LEETEPVPRETKTRRIRSLSKGRNTKLLGERHLSEEFSDTFLSEENDEKRTPSSAMVRFEEGQVE